MDSISEKVAFRFLEVLCSYSHSTAGEQRVGTGAGNVSLNNNWAVASDGKQRQVNTQVISPLLSGQ